MGIQRIATFTAGFILIMVALVIVLNLVRSRTGRAIIAVRDNLSQPEACGINVMKYKMIAFTISAAIAGAAGALYGLNYSGITAAKVRFQHVHTFGSCVRRSRRTRQYARLGHCRHARYLLPEVPRVLRLPCSYMRHPYPCHGLQEQRTTQIPKGKGGIADNKPVPQGKERRATEWISFQKGKTRSV